jgi:hypothetical protein
LPVKKPPEIIKGNRMAENSDVYRKLAQDIQAMFETELGKLDYRDCSKVFGIIWRENFSVAANACGRGSDNLTPDQQAEADLMMLL